MNSPNDSHGDSHGGSAGRSRSPRPPPGPPTEVWLWRIVPKKGRGEHRTFADNVRPEHWEDVWRHRHPGAGRYRIEFRDARLAIVRVEYANVPDPRSDAPIVYTTGRVRRPQRTMPPPSKAWEPRPPPPSTAPTRAAPTDSTQSGRVATTTSVPPTVPLLRPPGVPPKGTLWHRRKSGEWEPFDRRAALPKNCHRLWLEATEEVVLVFAPKGSWPGHEWGHLDDGRPCLFPRVTRR
jgi:hypothetical protein